MTLSTVEQESIGPATAHPHVHPTDTSGILRGLLSLSSQAAYDELHSGTGLVAGVISPNVARRLLAALQCRDVGILLHSQRAARISVGLANMLGWDDSQQDVLHIAALLHDLGKIGIPDQILFKPGRLSPEEHDLVRIYHRIAVSVLQACHCGSELLQIVSQLHSHFNGAADCPTRLGSELHPGARILAVADAYESMSSAQAFRAAKSHDEVLSILESQSGSRFDGTVVNALKRWLETPDGIEVRSGQTEQESARGAFSAGLIDDEDATEANLFAHVFSNLHLLETLYDGYYIVDADARFVVWSSGVEELFGLPADRMIRKTWSTDAIRYLEMLNKCELSLENAPIRRAMTSNTTVVQHLRLQDAQGTLHDVSIQTMPLSDRNGKVHGAVEILRSNCETRNRSRAYHELRLAATRDPLTSVANRGMLEQQLDRLMTDARSGNPPKPLCVMFLDIDHFKSINDNYGHKVGDEVLIELAKLVEHETYSGELFGRYGGEEFVLVCPDTDLTSAVRRAERLRRAISAARLCHDHDLAVTSSFGVAQMRPEDTSLKALLDRADKALYAAKEQGRNRACWPEDDQIDGDGGVRPSAPPKVECGPESHSGELLFSTELAIYFTADMVAFKLKGFADESNARILEFSPRAAKIKAGSRSLLPMWGSSDARQPVMIDLEFGSPTDRGRTPGRAENRRVTVSVRIRPLGWVTDENVFMQRCRRIVKSLRSYLASD